MAELELLVVEIAVGTKGAVDFMVRYQGLRMLCQ